MNLEGANTEKLKRDALSLLRVGWSVDHIASHFTSYREDYCTGLSLGSIRAEIVSLIGRNDDRPVLVGRPTASHESVLPDAACQTEQLKVEHQQEVVINWSPQQDAAIKAVNQWLGDRSSPQVFRLFGYAGTGKTTLAKHLVQDVSGRVLYAAFTGKASLVLRKKGCLNASTIHSLIYKPVEDPETHVIYYVLNLNSPVAGAGLVVVDEVSMVGEDLARDLLSFGTKILVLGDPAQLPPVKAEGFFINAKPDVMLTEVHRQAADNPIIRLSMDIREGRGLTPGKYGDSLIVKKGAVCKDEMREMVLAADQLLCGLNKTRHAYNARIRELRGLHGIEKPWHPVAGDRLICLRNDREKHIFNGSLWEAKTTMFAGGPANFLKIRINSLDEEDCLPIDVKTPEAYFNGCEKDLDWRIQRICDEFTFGWAITCHKAQGSQWENPLIFDESSCFRQDASKWLYTAVTRAIRRVTVVV
jgi:exodeoxyribonuclease V